MIDARGGSIGYSQAMIESNLEAMRPTMDLLSSTTAQYEQTVNQAKEQYLAVAFLAQVDRK